MSVNFNNYTAYSLYQPLSHIFPSPIVAKRAPTAADLYPIGQLWVYPATNSAYVITSIVNNAATWQDLSGAAGDFASLTVTPGPTNLTGTLTQLGNVNMNTSTAANTNIGTGTNTGTITIGNTAGAQNTNILAGTGNLLLDTAATASIDLGNSITTGHIVMGASMTSGTIVIGNATQTGVISLASTITALPGPVYVYTGAGAPGAGLALHVGDLYINTTAASATTRMYIATAAGTWTNVTCAA